MSTYLVTGGAGFIGSNLVHALVGRGETVVVLDNLSTGSEANLAAVRDKITFIKGDIREEAKISQAMRGVDYVLHQAALRAVERSIDNPLETNNVNITGTLQVLVAAQKANVRRFVFASSSSVYGKSIAERNLETLPALPASPYALSKLTGEHYSRLFSELFSLETVSLRYFNVFGPYQNPHSKYSNVLPLFVNALLKGATPEIHWDGQQSRDFTFVDNVVQANILAATGPTVRLGEVYNIGNGENTTIAQLYQQVQVLLGITRQPLQKLRRAGDVLKTHADISKAKRDLGYVPAISFAEGLARSIEWYKTHQ